MNRRKNKLLILVFVACLWMWQVVAGLAATDWSPGVLLTQPFDPTTNKISFSPSGRWGLFRESDQVTIQTTDDSAIQIFDLDGNSVYAGMPATLTLQRGHYIVECNGDRSQFCVLPDDYKGAAFLGTAADNGNNSQVTERIAAIHPTWVRTTASVWADVQPSRDVWDWTAMDKAVAANAGRKIIAISADLVPNWVAADELIARHSEYVRALAARYAGKLAAIEIWNEPWYNKFPATTNLDSFVSFYLELFSQGRQAIRTADRRSLVIGPAWSSIVRRESLQMSTNVLAKFGGWSWHDYTRGDYAPDEDYLAPTWVRSITKDNLRWAFGSRLVRKPLFVDEVGLYGQSALGCPPNTGDPLYSSGLTWYQGMNRAIKTILMYRAAGVQCILPQAFELANDSPNPNYEIFGWDLGYRGPHPKTSAALMTVYWLHRARFIASAEISNRVYLYAWSRPNAPPVVFAWSAEGDSVPLRSDRSLTTTDIYGRPIIADALGEQPVLFHPDRRMPAQTALKKVQALVQLPQL